MYGHTTPLLVLPFDHRSGFTKGLFNTEYPDAETIAKIKDMKSLIYESILAVRETLELPQGQFGILVDETYGEEILADAEKRGIPILQTVEKSGLAEFDFEYGIDFGTHLARYGAEFAKALVRFNPEGDQEANKRSLLRLKKLSDFCHHHHQKLLIEPLIPSTPEQLASVGGDLKRYDAELRPALTIAMIRAFQEAGVECDVWKIEGFTESEHYQAVLEQARNTPERATVSLIILGRNESKENVTAWITAGKNIPGVIGFAVGRTVFWEPLVQYRDGKIKRAEAIQNIADEFSYFVKIFLN